MATTDYEQSAGNAISGGAYADDIRTGDGADSIDAGASDDVVVGGAGNETVSLGAGNDSFGSTADLEDGDDVVHGGDGDDWIHGGNGDDWIHGGNGHDTLIGGAGTDYLYGGEGSDIFQIVDHHDITNVHGGTSSWDADTMWFSTYTSSLGITVTFADNTGGSYAFQCTAASGSFTEIEAVGGTSYGDTIDASASALNVTLWGVGGDDLIKGGKGHRKRHGHASLFGWKCGSFRNGPPGGPHPRWRRAPEPLGRGPRPR
nr:calcium-binding protein [Mangrovicoccus sp. HB161399]